ncbi:MAG TPA: hypothetical protein VGE40_10335, partial [Bacilli bacterium]
VSALRQVVFGPPMHQALNQLNEQLTLNLKSDVTIPPTLKASLTLLQDTIKQIQTISANYSNQLSSDQGDQTREANPIDPSKVNQPSGKQLAIQANVNLDADPSTGPPLNKTPVSSLPANTVLPEQAVKPDTKISVQGSAQSNIPGNTVNLVQNPAQSPVQGALSGSPEPSAKIIDPGIRITDSQEMVSNNKGKGLTDTYETAVKNPQNSAVNQASTNRANNAPSNASLNMLPIAASYPQGTAAGSSSGTSTVIPPNNNSTVFQPQGTPTPPKGGFIASPITSGEDQIDMISRMLKAVGLEHENQVVKSLGNLQLHNGKIDSNLLFAAVQSGENIEIPLFQRDTTNITNTLKSLLLQLSSANELPPALKENMQQLLQQVTGQQLFAIPDRTSMFSHITLFLPLTNANGEQTASVHVQSRRGKKGELDANNCRLLFDLHMKVLGETIVDVQVVNRIVALQVHNDHPFISEILESNRKEIAAAVEKVGYQFLSMKSNPFPAKENTDGSLEKHEVSNTAASLYGSKPYKGVDVRI